MKSKTCPSDVVQLFESTQSKWFEKDQLEGNNEDIVTPDPEKFSDFLRWRPYGADTAFGYTTLIDPRYHF